MNNSDFFPISQKKDFLAHLLFLVFFFNWDSPHARLKSHNKAWSYKKKAQKRPQGTENMFRKNPQLKDVC